MVSKRTLILYLSFMALGIGLGYLWWFYFGCTRGCKLDASPYWNMFRGLLLGAVVASGIEFLIERFRKQ